MGNNLGEGPEQRGTERTSLNVVVQVEWLDGGKSVKEECRVRDMSNTGLFLFTRRACAVGDNLTLRTELRPKAHEMGGLRLHCDATVVRVEKHSEHNPPTGIALRFGRADMEPF